MKERLVNTRFWSDGWVRKINALDRYLFIYLLTNEYTNIAGIYELPISTMAFGSGLDEKELESSMLPKLEPKVYYKDGWIILTNFLKHQHCKSDTVVLGIRNQLDLVPTEILSFAKSIGYGQGIDRVWVGYNILEYESKPKQNITTKVAYEAIDKELSLLLLEKIRENTPTFKEPNLDKWANHVRLMRMNDNRTPEQIRFLIEWSQKHDFWSANILSTDKLRKKFDTLVAQLKRDTKPKIKDYKVAFS